MKTIQQLIKIARRIPKRVRGAMHQLTKKRRANEGLTPRQVQYYRDRVSTGHMAGMALKAELTARNIGGLPSRDATPHRLRCRPAAPHIVAPEVSAEVLAALQASAEAHEPRVMLVDEKIDPSCMTLARVVARAVVRQEACWPGGSCQPA
jgi:hypothetical protein